MRASVRIAPMPWRSLTFIFGASTVWLLLLFWLRDDLGDPRWGDWATWAGALITAGLLTFEVQRAASEHRKRLAAEAESEQALARRVLAWVERTLYKTNRQGVVSVAPGGWQLAVVNGTDDLLTEWWVAVTNEQDTTLIVASHLANGALPPRSRTLFDVPESAGYVVEDEGRDLPEDYVLKAKSTMNFVDRQGQSWCRDVSGGLLALSKFGLPAEASDQRLNARRLYPGWELHRQGISQWRLDDPGFS